MATVILPDTMTIPEAAALLEKCGKRLRYHQGRPNHKDTPDAHHRPATHTQPACRLAGSTHPR